MIHAGPVSLFGGTTRFDQAWEVEEIASGSRPVFPEGFRIPNCLASVVLVAVTVLAVLILIPGSTKASDGVAASARPLAADFLGNHE